MTWRFATSGYAEVRLQSPGLRYTSSVWPWLGAPKVRICTVRRIGLHHIDTRQTRYQEDPPPEAMAQINPPGIMAAQLAQLAMQLATLQGEVTTLCQENVALTTANTTLTTQVAEIANAPTAAAKAVGGAPGAPIRATFATTPAMLRHENILNYLSTPLNDDVRRRL